MRSRKKFLIILLAGLSTLTFTLALGSCNQSEPPPQHEHIWSEWGEVPATCTEEGEQKRICYSLGCDVVTETQTIPALGHELVQYEGQEATYEEDGWDAYEECTRDGCDYTTYKVIPVLKHTTVWHKAKSATCTEIGWCGYYECTDEDCDYTTYVEIPALGHDKEQHNAKEATCTEIGWDAHETCKRDGCGYTTYVEIPALGHNYKDRVCTNCGEKLPSEGLAFTKISGKEEYAVTGIGTCTDTDIVIPSKYDGLPVTSIGKSAFEYCYNLTSVEIPDSVTSIGYCAFSDCDSLTNINVGEENTAYKDIDGNLYSKDGSVLIQYAIGKTATQFVIPDSVTSIGDKAFSYCSSLTSVEIPDSVTSIGYCAFSDCDSLTSVVIPDSVTSIGEGAFSSCKSLTSIEIGDNVTSIDYQAFSLCYRLVEVYNKSSLTITAGSSDNGSVGSYAKNVYTPTSGSSKLSNDNGYIVYTDGEEKILVGYNGEETNLVLPSYITQINKYAFRNCDSLTSVVIPDSVTSIGYEAFYDCRSLTSVEIPDSVTSIGNRAFYDCDSLTSVVIPDGVTSIGNRAFYDCDSLTSVTFESTEGWFVADSSTATSGTNISSADLSNTATAAAYLKSTYRSYYWKRSE